MENSKNSNNNNDDDDDAENKWYNVNIDANDAVKFDWIFIK